MKKRKAFSIKGLQTPRILIWLLGLLHGKIMRAGTIDPDSNLLCGSYITSKSKLYKEYCHKRIGALEEELKGLRTEASCLMFENETLQGQLSTLVVDTAPAESNQQKRIAARTATVRSSALARKDAVLLRLSEIGEEIRSKEMACREELAATAEALQSRFSTYGHGMLLRPVFQKAIPPLEYEGCLRPYQQLHEETDTRLANMIRRLDDHE